MATTYPALTELYNESIQKLSQDAKTWMSFLTAACHNYKLSFDDLVLIYAQRPDVIALMTFDQWTNGYKRTVKSGSSGIAVFDTQRKGRYLKYYFDIADTNIGSYSKPIPLWEIQPEYEVEIIETLENAVGILPVKETLSSAILSAAEIAADDNMQAYLEELLFSTDGSRLEGFDIENITVRFREALTNSIACMMLTRCGIDASMYLDEADFEGVAEFDTLDTVNILGTATRDITEPMLREIGRTAFAVSSRTWSISNLQHSAREETPPTLENADNGVNSHARAKRSEILSDHRRDMPADTIRTVANENPVLYDGDRDRLERSDENGDRLHETGGLPVPEPDSRDTGRTGSDREIRENAGKLPERTPQGDIHEPADNRQAEQASIGDSGNRSSAGIGNYSKHGESRGRDGGTESARPNALDGPDEQPEASSGGNRAERPDLLLSFPDYPTEIEQISFFEAEVSSVEEAPAFSLSQQAIDEILCMGSNRDHSLERICLNYMKDRTQAENLAFLKKEFADGGNGLILDGQRIAVWYSPEGIHISPGDTAFQTGYLVSIEDMDSRIKELLALGRFVPQDILDTAIQHEYAHAAERFLYFYREVEEEHRFLAEYPIQAGFPVAEAAMTEKLHDMDFLQELISQMTIFEEKYRNNPSVMRFQHPKPTEILTLLTDLTIPNKAYTSHTQQLHDAVKYITQDEVDRCLTQGFSSYAKYRISEYFSEDRTLKEKADFLKKEHTTGGTTAALPATDKSYLDYSSKGIVLSRGSISEPYAKVTLSWQQAAKRIERFIQQDNYLTQADIDDYPKYLAGLEAQKEKRARFDLVHDAINLPPEEKSDTFFRRLSYFIMDLAGYERNVLLENGAESFFGADERELNLLLQTHENRETLSNAFARLQGATSDAHTRNHSHQFISEIRAYEPAMDNGQVTVDNDSPEGDVSSKIETVKVFQTPLYDIEIAKLHTSQEQEVPANEDLIGKEIILEGSRFVIESVGNISHEVSMRDLTFEEKQGFPIFRSEKLGVVRRLLEQEQTAELPQTQETEKSGKVNTIHINISNNFRITDETLGQGGPKAKYQMNIAAIQVLKQIELENRHASPEEQEILHRYVGWGGIPQAFDERNDSWSSEYEELKNLLTEKEYSSAIGSTLNAHYTTPTVINAIYQAVQNLGFKTGNILDPGCGVGNFQGLLPQAMQDSKIYGVELDSITGRIVQQLYPHNDIRIEGFEKSDFPDSLFDLVVGNFPFGSYRINDKKYDKLGLNIHEYFLAKSLDKVRPGGVIAFVTSSWMLDKQNPQFRKYTAQRAELLGAIRLPNTAFKANAGTEVTTDIIFLQKRDRMIDIEPDWLNLEQLTVDNGQTIPLNAYFAAHPEMMLGTMTRESGSRMYGSENSIACIPFPDSNLKDQLTEAVTHIRGQITEYEREEDEADRTVPADPAVRNFSYTVYQGELYFRENSRMRPVSMNKTALDRAKELTTLRDCLRSLIDLQLEDADPNVIISEQQKLNRLYDRFVKKHGRINSRANASAFLEDSSYFLLSSLEVNDEDGNFKRKADMFSKRTIKPYIAVTHCETASEALAVSIGERAKVDLPFMAALTDISEEQLITELQGVIFRNLGDSLADFSAYDPNEKDFVTADEYLSGNVRRKLHFVKKLLEVRPDLQAEYSSYETALEHVQPKDLSASEISVRLGTTWIPQEIYQQFMYETFGTIKPDRIRLFYNAQISEWTISNKTIEYDNMRVTKTYGTKRRNAYQILENTLNLRDIKIFDKVYQDGEEKSVLNVKETMLAQGQQEKLKTEFQSWIWKEPERRQRLTAMYNEQFNAIRPREYDGSHIIFHGMNPEITLRAHQINAVARGLYGGNTLLAHEVGAGKTFEMIAIAMEAKSLGLCGKSMFVVPNHIIDQFAAEWLQLYPSANILVSTKKDFETKNRKKFISRIATGDYDAVIIGHSQFEKIPISEERQQRILEDQIVEITIGIEQAKEEDGEHFSIKQMERTKKSLESRLEKLNDRSQKDNVITFEETGIDKLFVDEAHGYKNLFLATKMRNVGGIAQTDAKKSSDLFMKCRYLDELTGSKGIVFATGTPISNSMVELYTMQRYLQYELLVQNGLQHFDGWASTFGETVTAMELAPEGYNLVGR